jgi:Kef-type K+ transport system membrane component KefB
MSLFAMTPAELASRLFLQLACILLACRAVGWFTSRVRQPYVIAEMVAGFLLGPSFFGWLAPGVNAWLFPEESMPALYVMSQLGLMLYMFCVGLEFRIDQLSRFGRAAMSITVAGITAPFLLGGGLALALLAYGGLFPETVTPLQAALFMAAAMSITAFPVLARIISERGIGGTSIGSLALAAGALNDAAAWMILSVVLSLFTGNSMLAAAALGGAVIYAAAMVAIRPLLKRLATRVAADGTVPPTVLIAMLALLATGAWFTESAGLHAVFGSFLLGVAVPRGPMADGVRGLIEPVATAAFVPLFFVYSGLNTQLGLLDSAAMWGIAAIILITACAGKGIACWGAARLAGWPSREAMAVATLMNTRGMVELILLNIGLQRGIITPTLFTMMVMMAIATTVMTGPLFSLLWERGAAEAPDSSKKAYVQ